MLNCQKPIVELLLEGRLHQFKKYSLIIGKLMDKYLSITGRYIYLSPNLQIINPSHLGTIFRYEGLIERFDLKNQKNNYEKIKKVLGGPMDYIYVGKFMGDTKIKLVFLAHTGDRRVWWRKDETGGEGGGNNWIYEDGIRYNLKNWLKKK